MDVLENKQLLAKAIDSYELYTSRQKEILKILINMSIDGVATVGTLYLMEKTDLSRAAVYLNLKKFSLEGIISKIRKPKERLDSYQLSQEKLAHILQLYRNKEAMEK